MRNILRTIAVAASSLALALAATQHASAADAVHNVNSAGNEAGYVALGDSVAAGLGLEPAVDANEADPRCGQSLLGYPNLVATSLNMPFQNVSCSGATVGDLVTKQAVDGPNIDAQLDQAFQSGTPSLLTLTAGANDARWANFIKACYARNCTGKSYDTAAKAYIVAMRTKLAFALKDIERRSDNNPPRVIMTGYYNPLSKACADNNLTSKEISWLTSKTAALNKALREVGSRYSFVDYASISFSGHDACADDPWVQGLNDAAPFHPTAAGQERISQRIIDVYNN